MYRLYRKKRSEAKKYITDYNRFGYYRKFNSISDDKVFDNKWTTYNLLEEYYKREAILINNEDDYELFQRFCLVHRGVVLKPLFLSCGQGIEFFDALENSEDIRAAFEAVRSKLPCMVEEPIIQSKEMAFFNASSVNTVRLCTIMTNDRKVVPFFPWLKTGRKGSKVDNGGAGGIVSSIDFLTGKIVTDGADEMCGHYETNPDYGYRYREMQLPDWENAVELAVKLQSLFPNHRCTAWDLAHTDQGWVLVEGNSGGQFLQQIPLNHGLKPEIKKLI